MTTQIAIPSDPVADGARRIVFKLERNEEGKVNVAACEILNKNFTNRTLFHGSSDIWEVLVDDLAAALVRLTDDLDENHSVVSLPDVCIELPGLTLSGLHVIVSDISNGTQKIMVRFQVFLGSLGAILRSKVGFSVPSPATHERVALDVLTDLALPLLDLARLSEDDFVGHEVAVYERQKKLAERASEITFYVELLKRFKADAPHVPQEAHIGYEDQADNG